MDDDRVEDALKFIARLHSLLQNERQAEIEQNSLLLSSCSPKTLEQRGLALCNLGVANISVGLGGRNLVELERPPAYHSNPTLPPNTFRPGDLGRIEAYSDSASSSRSKSKIKKGPSTKSERDGVEGVIYKISDTRIIVAVDQPENSNDDLDIPQRCLLVKLANSITYDRMEKTLNSLRTLVEPQNNNPKATSSVAVIHLARVLLALESPSPSLALNSVEFFDQSLNESQKDAVRFALESAEVACIHGPPGTGKTHTLIEIVRQLLSDRNDSLSPRPAAERRILVCGASNLSVDNLLERLALLPASSQGPMRCTRLGHPARFLSTSGVQDATLDSQAFKSEQASLVRDIKNELELYLLRLAGKEKGQKGKAPRGEDRRKLWTEVRELRKEYRKRERGVTKSILDKTQVVLATCHSAGGRQLQNMEFDVVIIDEATQALEPACWIPILKSKKVILAGDPMQLPPTILSQKKALAKDYLIKAKSPEQKHTTKEVSVTGVEDATSSSGSATDEEGKAKPKLSRANIKDRVMLKAPRTLETTLFERLERMYGTNIKRTLKVQYRMHNDICAFPNKTLYRSQLQSYGGVAEHLLRDLPNVDQNLSTEDIEETLSIPIVFFDTQGCDYYERSDGDDQGSKLNENEATVVCMWVEKLTKTGLLPSQLAIITPYQAQVSMLASMLRPKYGSELEIGTVDGMQGREKEAIIISLVRSNEARDVGFLSEKRRLNVAMTRARRHLCVIGDSSTVKNGSPYLKKWMAWLETNADVRFGG